jgi:hypothetical protein
MRAALELGRWTFPAPIGYLNAPKWSGKSLVPDPERAPLIARAFEELATGRFTKQEVIARMSEAGLRTRRGLVLSPQSFGQMVRNSIYIGMVESPDYGVSTRGDFDPLVDEATFYRVQAVLDGRVVVAGPRPRNHPDFPLRRSVRCETCGRPLTGSWSKGRNGHYAYYHCQRQCRAVNVSKVKLEGAFVDELALLQPTPGYMRLVKDRILHLWEQRRAEAKDRTAEQHRRVHGIQLKLDRLDEAFLYSESIDVTSYGRQRDKLREELTLAQIDHHSEAIDELDVQGILAFAERILPRASDLWVQASLDQKQRLQQLFFPEGVTFDGTVFNRTAITAPFFKYLAPSESADEKMVSRVGIEPTTRRLRETEEDRPARARDSLPTGDRVGLEPHTNTQLARQRIGHCRRQWNLMASLEQNVGALEELPAKVASLESQFLQLRTEVRVEFSAVRAEIQAGDIQTRQELRTEIREMGEQLRSLQSI